jgi:DNA modification methylase
MIQITSINIDKLIPYVNNARTHSAEQVAQIAASIQEFGWTNPVLIDGKNGLIAGHGRLLAARKLGMTEIPSIQLENLTETQKKALILADNKLALTASWDNELLAIELDDLKSLDYDLDLIGFTADEIAAIMPQQVEGLTDEDAVPDAPETPVTVIGDIWILGNHRLMCGDSTSIDAVDKLMDGQKADIVFTDPPYGMFLDTDYTKMPSVSKDGNKNYDAVKGDNDDFDSSLINTVFANFNYCKEIFLWGADYYAEHLPNKNGGSWVVWDKRVEEKFDRMIGSGFELCWSKAKHKRMIARINNTLFSGDPEARNKSHPTQKPTKLVDWFFEYYSLKDKVNVVDLYGGSGTTLLSCEKHSKKCFMSELDPKYCDVIVKRWQDFTGKQAIHADTGLPF